MNRESKIYIAGNTGMVGSAIVRKLTSGGYNNLAFTPRSAFDLTDQKTVLHFFEKERPEYVFIAAAKVGGILSNNTFRAQFIYENLMIQNNIIHSSYLCGVKKLLFLGSSCIYPKNCPQPISENYLLTGELEYTNEPYAVAKIAGIKMCESYNLQYGTNFLSVMPTNLYGPNDNYDLETSHVLPAMIRKMHLAKCLETGNWNAIRNDLNKSPVGGIDGKKAGSEVLSELEKYGIKLTGSGKRNNKAIVSVMLWGTGNPFREFLYVDDMADACIFLMQNVNAADLVSYNTQKSREIRNTHINIGTGKDMPIKDLALLIKKITGFSGEITWDHSKPDGTFRKLLDCSKINCLGWKEKTSLEEGIRSVYQFYSEN